MSTERTFNEQSERIIAKSLTTWNRPLREEDTDELLAAFNYAQAIADERDRELDWEMYEEAADVMMTELDIRGRWAH